MLNLFETSAYHASVESPSPNAAFEEKSWGLASDIDIDVCWMVDLAIELVVHVAYHRVRAPADRGR